MSDFREDFMYCERCRSYVPYLRSLDASYCTVCDGQVTLLPREEMRDVLREAGGARGLELLRSGSGAWTPRGGPDTEES